MEADWQKNSKIVPKTSLADVDGRHTWVRDLGSFNSGEDIAPSAAMLL